jgi:hypothetical protein
MDLYYTHIFNITAHLNFWLSRNTGQYLSEVRLQQFHYSTCSTAVHFNRTVSGRLKHITQDCTLRQNILLLTNTRPQDSTSQRSVFLASSEPSALELPTLQSHYLMCFTGGTSSRTVTFTLLLPTSAPLRSLAPLQLNLGVHSQQLVTLGMITVCLHC